MIYTDNYFLTKILRYEKYSCDITGSHFVSYLFM